ncbi:MAG: hypothetical protein KDN05_05060 [Verrucomicrobiae bacterium]|nr:hypothetical protein [Verrucomicrobiae bacterium]
MKKLPLSLLQLGILTSVAVSQTTVVEESFTYSDGAVDAVGTGGTGWDATEGAETRSPPPTASTSSPAPPSIRAGA